MYIIIYWKVHPYKVSRIGYFENLNEPYPSYDIGPMSIELVFNGYRDNILEGAITFTVSSFEDFDLLQELYEILLDFDDTKSLSWKFDTQDLSFNGNILILKITKNNMVSAFDFFYNYKLIILED